MTDKNYSDSELMENLANGDQNSLAQLYKRHGNSILGFIHKTVGDYSTAEDLCQEVFLVVANKAEVYKEKGKFRCWLYGIAANKARNHLRKRWLRNKLLFQHHEDLLPPEDKIFSPELQALKIAFSKLAPKDREILVLQVSEGLSGEEIAETLSIKHAAVRVRLYRARKKLKKLIEKELKTGSGK
ncbi:MAG: RNA polymerase sigma factor [Myxococcota bacterium]